MADNREAMEAAIAELRKEAAAAWAEMMDVQATLWEKWQEGARVRKAKLAKLKLIESGNEERD